MSALSLNQSIERAAERLAERSPHRRADAGQSRLPKQVLAQLRRQLLGQERPRIVNVLADLRRYCQSRQLACPARATVYNLMEQIQGHSYEPATLPEAVRAALYNLSLDTPVPGHQLAYYCFHYGGLRALSYAAGLPWLDLYQAAHMPGWRPRTRGLLEAVLLSRGIA